MGSVWNGKKLSNVTWATAKSEDIAYTAKIKSRIEYNFFIALSGTRYHRLLFILIFVRIQNNQVFRTTGAKIPVRVVYFSSIIFSTLLKPATSSL